MLLLHHRTSRVHLQAGADVVYVRAAVHYSLCGALGTQFQFLQACACLCIPHHSALTLSGYGAAQNSVCIALFLTKNAVLPQLSNPLNFQNISEVDT